MDEQTAAALERVKQAAAAHQDADVELPAADLAAVAGYAAGQGNQLGKELAAAATAARKGRTARTVTVNRAAHLTPLLKVVAGE